MPVTRMCKAGLMRIGILGGTGPAGSALGARLASIGYDVIIGSRSADRASEVCTELATKYPEISDRLSGGDNARAAAGDVIVVAGKGHETYQEVAGERRPYSDARAVDDALAGRSAA